MCMSVYVCVCGVCGLCVWCMYETVYECVCDVSVHMVGVYVSVCNTQELYVS